jgi:RHS repeat-associated protein
LSATYGNGIVATAAYSPQTFELTSLSYAKGSTTLFGVNYYYQQNSTNCPTGNSVGNDGQIQCIVDTVQPGRSVAYTYDALGRLLTAGTTGSTAYPQWGMSETYDRYGNRSAQTATAGTVPQPSFSINPANNQITTFTYDAAGNIIGTPPPADTYTYDHEECNTGYTGGGSTATYTCDGNGMRVEKVVTGTDAVTTVYVRIGGQVIAEYDNGAAVDSPTREYLYGNKLLATITGSTSGSGGTIIYQHGDHLSPRFYSDVNGNCVGDQGTFPFGEPWYTNDDPNCNTTASSSWIYTSYERDAESGNDYALARSYANTQGRFMSPDPLEGIVGDPQSWNRYAYVENDPINLSDPSGQGFWEDLGFAIANLFIQFITADQLDINSFGADDGDAKRTETSCTGGLLVPVSVRLLWCIPACGGGGTGGVGSGGNTGTVNNGNTGSGSSNSADASATGGGAAQQGGGGAGAGSAGTTSGASSGQTSGSQSGSPSGSAAPPNSRTDVVLIPAGSGVPQPYGFGGQLWSMNWKIRETSGNKLVPPGFKNSQGRIQLTESKNGGPFVTDPAAQQGGFQDLISTEPKTVIQQFSFNANGTWQRIQVSLPDGKGNFVRTWQIKMTISARFQRPVYAPFP